MIVLLILINTARPPRPPQKKSPTLIFSLEYGIRAFCCGVVLTNLCNVYLLQHLFPSTVAFIFGQDFVLMSLTIPSVFSFNPKDIQWG